MQDHEIDSLVNQESFLNYCFRRNSIDVLYWENWLSENLEYKQKVEDLKRLVILIGDESRNRIKEENFALLQKRIGFSVQHKGPKMYPFWKRWSIAAAIIFVTTGAGLFFLYRYKTESVAQYGVANDVAPGGNKATLILANGKKINLTDAINGAIANQSGIKIIKTADGKIVYDVANTDAAVDSYNTIETPYGGQYQVNLSDGTKVWLNSGSSLRYPLKFSGNERKIQLLGEGYFEVAKNEKMPFRVVSGKQTVEVLGTHFNIMAYADEKSIKTSLLEGSVNIHYNGKEARLLPGQQSQMAANKINIISDADMEEAIAWKDGYFKFNEDLVSIMNKISRWYGVEVVYYTKPNLALTYSGKISRARNISAILKIIEFDSDVHFKVDGKRVYVTN